MESKICSPVNHNRVKLQEAIPLKTPFLISIEPSDKCNFKCEFCPLHTEETSQIKNQDMKWENFTKIIDDIAMFPQKIKKIRLSGQGEPLINPELPRMVEYIKNKGIVENLEIVTNGSLLTPRLSDAIIAAGLDRIQISIEGLNAKTYKQICKANIHWDNFLSNIQYFYNHRKQCHVYIKIMDVVVPTDELRKEFYDTFAPTCDSCYIDHVAPIWPGFDKIYQKFEIDREHGIHGQTIENIKVCPTPFYELLILTTGDVTPCCVDWKRQMVIGNVLEKHLMDIWNGEKHMLFLKEMLRNGREAAHPMCANCAHPNCDVHDNIDPYRDIILKRLL